MKYCPVDGLRYPNEYTHCRGCGAALVPASAMRDFSNASTISFATSACPNPRCSMLVAPSKTKFCAHCGQELKPISFELWMDKIVKPAFNERPVEVLLDSDGLFSAVAEMGLAKDEAEKYLDQIWSERTGVGRNAFDSWLKDATALLSDEQVELESAKRQAAKRAAEQKIYSLYSSLIIERLTEGRVAPSIVSPSVASSGESPSVAQPIAGQEGDVAKDADRISRLASRRRSREADDAAASETEDETLVRARPLKPLWVNAGEATAATEQTLSSVTDKEKRRTSVVKSGLIVLLILTGIFVALWLLSSIHLSRKNDQVNDNQSPVASASATSTPLNGEAGPASTPDNNQATPNALASTEQSLNANVAATENGQPTAATLSLYSNVDGVTVWIDDALQGTVSRSQMRSISLSPGAHVVRAAKSNYPSWERQLELAAGQRLNVSIVMEQSQAANEPARPEPTSASSNQPSSEELARGHQQNAENLFQQGQVEAAIAETDAGLKLDPRSQPLRSLRGKLERARNLLNNQSAIAADPLGPAQRGVAPPSRTQPGASTSVAANHGAQLINMPTPVYPSNALSLGVATVWVEVMIDERGYAYSARAVRGPSQLYTAAISVARQSRFHPAQRNGQPVADKQILPVMFSPR